MKDTKEHFRILENVFCDCDALNLTAMGSLSRRLPVAISLTCKVYFSPEKNSADVHYDRHLQEIYKRFTVSRCPPC